MYYDLRGIKLVKAFGYDKVRLYRHATRAGAHMLETMFVPRAFVRALEEELVKQAGWGLPDNKTFFLFDHEDAASGVIHYGVKFHDLGATFVSWIGNPYNLPANIEIL